MAYIIWGLFLIISIILFIAGLVNFKQEKSMAENEKALNLFWSALTFFILFIITIFVSKKLNNN
jgi:tellurite resistance protein TehA-like permease